MIDIRLPQITGVTEKEQLQQVKSYLFQLASQLQWALQNIDTVNISTAGTTPQSQITNPYGVSTIGSQGDGNAYATFNSIKALIIKSAEIVDAYYQEINRRIEGTYVAQSDFGNYAQQTSQQIEETSTSTMQMFENLQVITTNHGSNIADVNKDLQDTKLAINESIQGVQSGVTGVNALLEDAKAQLKGSIDDLAVYVTGLNDVINGVSAYLKSGLLYTTDGGIPVYGIEIGQSVKDEVAGTEVFNKFTRFTSEKLSFYDANGNEVAYISDNKLYIRIAEITVAFKLGGIISLVMSNGDVVDKWIGG